MPIQPTNIRSEALRMLQGARNAIDFHFACKPADHNARADWRNELIGLERKLGRAVLLAEKHGISV